jgi:hypothetical protein
MKMLSLAKAVIAALLLTTFSALPASAIVAPTNVQEESTSPVNTALDAASARISWPVVADAIGYSVNARAGGINIPGNPPACNQNECVSLLEGLTGGVDYSITVVAANSQSDSVESLPISHRALSSPGSPQSTNVTPGSKALTMTWLEPANIGGLPLLGYQIISPDRSITTLSSTASSFVATGLTNGVSYQYTIRARNANGLSEPISFSAATPVGVPDAPASPTVTSTSNSITATWRAPLNDGGEDITGYTVRLLVGGTVTASAVPGAAVRSHTFNGLADGNFTVRVLATNNLGTSDPSPASAPVILGTALQSQTIIFPPIPEQKLADSTLTLSVSATSQLAVSLSDSGPCTVAGQVVTFTGVGSCTITATQAGGSGFAAAAPFSRSFAIVQSTEVTATPPATGVAITPVINSFTTISNLVSTAATVVLAGTNLSQVVSVQLGAVLGRIVQQSDTALTASFDPIEPGTYSLVVVAGAVRQTFSNAVVVRDSTPTTSSPATTSSSTVSPETPNRKITIGTFKGFVAIYFKGYEGTRVSIKIAGKWQVVPRVPKDFHRVVRRTGAGFVVKSEVYIDRKLVQERRLTTR